MKANKFNKAKFKSLVHYICDKCSPDPSVLGAVKLNKVLWFSDILMYMNHGQSITGERYVKRERGPVPSHILTALRELEKSGKLLVRDVPFFGFQKKEYISLKAADSDVFDEQERDLIDAVIDQICNGHTAKSVSELTHNQVWDAAEIGDEIPYHAAFAMRSGEIDEDDMAWAKRVAEKVAEAA